ncbi:hypothetical protein BAY61_32225 (plasmid) [Prauserella marina]|uniref:Ftsk gamma domain-containing protein n=1 Tax=Prauserella marina TaxID=530584 RepID=A0A222W1V7_9PSEU|nr:DNA translocase FtsK [Prauserella marina]ASR39951.1 hypothetical protein BAY61_32225 [Prauserella marina]PWV71287.1 FtsK-like protein [Prauserella marina]SDD97319.1 Ftsk gamma domain-containing protein [Prauserella marina]
MELDQISKEVAQSLAQLASIALSLSQHTQQLHAAAAQQQHRELRDRERITHQLATGLRLDDPATPPVPGATARANDWSAVDDLAIEEQWVFAAVREHAGDPGATSVRTVLDDLLEQRGVERAVLDNLRSGTRFRDAAATISAHLTHAQQTTPEQQSESPAAEPPTLQTPRNPSTYRRSSEHIPTNLDGREFETRQQVHARIGLWSGLAEQGQRNAVIFLAEPLYGHDSDVDDLFDLTFPEVRDNRLAEAQAAMLRTPTAATAADLAYLAGRAEAAPHRVQPEITPALREVAREVTRTQFAAVPTLQRKLGLSRSEATGALQDLEQLGVVGPSNGDKARDVLMRPEQLDTILGPPAPPGPDPAGNIYADGSPAARIAGASYPDSAQEAVTRARRSRATPPRPAPKPTRQRDRDRNR